MIDIKEYKENSVIYNTNCHKFLYIEHISNQGTIKAHTTDKHIRIWTSVFDPCNILENKVTLTD